MISKGESHTSGQESVINSTWLPYILEEWTCLEYHYLKYIGFFLWMLHIIFFAPHLLFIGFCCFSNLFLYIYKRKNGLEEDLSIKSWDKGRFMVASIISMCGKLWHGKIFFPLNTIVLWDAIFWLLKTGTLDFLWLNYSYTEMGFTNRSKNLLIFSRHFEPS